MKWYTYLLIALVSTFVLIGLCRLAQAEEIPLRPVFPDESKQDWGCNWFEIVEMNDYLTMIVDKRTNDLVLTWDTNGDHKFDIQRVYTIIGYDGNGWIPVMRQVPKYVLLDLDKDGKLDLKLYNESEGKNCSDWRSIPLPDRPKSGHKGTPIIPQTGEEKKT